MLIKAGADISATSSSDGASPLMRACEGGCVVPSAETATTGRFLACAAALMGVGEALEAGCDVAHQDLSGHTALHVAFRHRQADMASLYRHARGLVMPTFFGPTNIPPLEAFAVGCPVAVSSVYGMPEQLGDAALYFDPTSVYEIAACVRKLWVDDSTRQTLIDRGTAHHNAWCQPHFNARFAEILEQLT